MSETQRQYIILHNVPINNSNNSNNTTPNNIPIYIKKKKRYQSRRAVRRVEKTIACDDRRFRRGVIAEETW